MLTKIFIVNVDLSIFLLKTHSRTKQSLLNSFIPLVVKRKKKIYRYFVKFLCRIFLTNKYLFFCCCFVFFILGSFCVGQSVVPKSTNKAQKDATRRQQ